MDDEPDRLSNRLLEYDPNTNKWTELGPMKYSKYRCSAVVLNGEIFVMGKILCSVNLNKMIHFSAYQFRFILFLKFKISHGMHIKTQHCHDPDT